MNHKIKIIIQDQIIMVIEEDEIINLYKIENF